MIVELTDCCFMTTTCWPWVKTYNLPEDPSIVPINNILSIMAANPTYLPPCSPSYTPLLFCKALIKWFFNLSSLNLIYSIFFSQPPAAQYVPLAFAIHPFLVSFHQTEETRTWYCPRALGALVTHWLSGVFASIPNLSKATDQMLSPSRRSLESQNWHWLSSKCKKSQESEFLLNKGK